MTSRAVLLTALALALAMPPVQADPIETTGLPLPDLAGDQEDRVRVDVQDTEGGAGAGAKAGGMQAQAQTGCGPDVAACEGHVCFAREGYGPLPAAISDGEGGVGFGVDLSLLHELLGTEGTGPAPQEGNGESGQEPENQFGPYSWAFVSPQGQCGP